jgi:hypothetical protein
LTAPNPAPRLLGIVRGVDPVLRRHWTALGERRPERSAWELGAALDQDPGGGVPLWIDSLGRLYTNYYAPRPLPPNVRKGIQWALQPAFWRGTGSPGARARSVGRRSWDAIGHALSARRAPGPWTPEGKPLAWLWARAAEDRVPLYSAIHPVTGDQLVTRDVDEPRELGYEQRQLLGYAAAAAPLTGTLARPPAAVPWAYRFGLTVTGNGDALARSPTSVESVAAAKRLSPAMAEATDSTGSPEIPLLFRLGTSTRRCTRSPTSRSGGS